MTAVLNTARGSSFIARRVLLRHDGGYDVVVAYRRQQGAPATYSAYRQEPDGTWKCLNAAWSDVDTATSHAPDITEHAPLVTVELQVYLSEAIASHERDELAAIGGDLA